MDINAQTLLLVAAASIVLATLFALLVMGANPETEAKGPAQTPERSALPWPPALHDFRQIYVTIKYHVAREGTFEAALFRSRFEIWPIVKNILRAYNLFSNVPHHHLSEMNALRRLVLRRDARHWEEYWETAREDQSKLVKAFEDYLREAKGGLPETYCAKDNYWWQEFLILLPIEGAGSWEKAHSLKLDAASEEAFQRFLDAYGIRGAQEGDFSQDRDRIEILLADAAAWDRLHYYLQGREIGARRLIEAKLEKLRLGGG